jgi:hypothetical protein
MRPAANSFPSLIIAMGFTGQLLRITLSISRFLYMRVWVCANPAPEEVFIGWKLAALWLSAAEDSNAHGQCKINCSCGQSFECNFDGHAYWLFTLKCFICIALVKFRWKLYCLAR